jgi:manganese transport protein
MGTTVAGVVFAIALLCSGQSSTLTGTLAGQIVMEGFLDVRLRPWLRRLITRSLAILPAAATIYFAGDRSTYQLLLLSQVVLSMQLPFAVIPLIHFTSDRKRMGAFANKLWVVVLAWATAAVIVALNLRLLAQSLVEWIGAAGEYRIVIGALVVAAAAGLGSLLLWITLQPLFARWGFRFRRSHVTLAEAGNAAADVMAAAPVYRRILVPLDHTRLDRTAIAHAAAMARSHHAKLFLFHVEEGVTSQVYGELSSTAEVKAGQKYLDDIVASLRADSIEVETEVCHSLNPKREIVRYARRIQPDLLIMGAHGHGRLGDLIFGDTINPVRHQLNVPILVVRDPGK